MKTVGLNFLLISCITFSYFMGPLSLNKFFVDIGGGKKKIRNLTFKEQALGIFSIFIFVAGLVLWTY